MPVIKCNQCGMKFNLKGGKECPWCHSSLKDEFLEMLRAKVRRSYTPVIISILLALAVLGMSLAAVDEARHYRWDEPVTSPVTVKDQHTDLVPIWVPNPDGKGGHFIYIPEEDYVLTLEDGTVEDVDHGTYDSYEVGDNYTYYIAHRDWKPEMEDAPIPKWIFIAPFAVASAGLLLFTVPVSIRRLREYREWLETGDLEIAEG